MTPRERTTGIEWTEHTWNPFAGCSLCTAGCTNCYAMAQAARLERFGMPTYQGTTKTGANGKAVFTGRINRATNATMKKPLTIRDASRIFVNSMSDFWHENARDEWRLEALEIMARTPHHYQVLTKRPQNIAPFLERTGVALPANFWLGATVERSDFIERIDIIRAIPARTRFLSVEPLIGPLGPVDLTDIHWVIIGGESGPGAREMHADWAREVRDQCIAQGVRLFFKQWGIAQNNPLYATPPPGLTGAQWVGTRDPVGKGGSLLDGVEWKQYPDVEVQRALDL